MIDSPISLVGKLNREIEIENDTITIYRCAFRENRNQSFEDDFIIIPVCDVVDIIFQPIKGIGYLGFLSIVDRMGNGRYENDQQALVGRNAVVLPLPGGRLIASKSSLSSASSCKASTICLSCRLRGR